MARVVMNKVHQMVEGKGETLNDAMRRMDDTEDRTIHNEVNVQITVNGSGKTLNDAVIQCVKDFRSIDPNCHYRSL